MTTIEVPPLPTFGPPLPAPKQHTINVPFMRKVLEYLETNPQKHEQGCWAWTDVTTIEAIDTSYDCGTVACMAGWAVLLSGTGRWYNSVCCEACASTPELEAVIDGISYQVQEGAEKLLGLTWEQADRLFSGGNSRDDLWELADEYTFGEISADERLAYRG